MLGKVNWFSDDLFFHWWSKETTVLLSYRGTCNNRNQTFTYVELKMLFNVNDFLFTGTVNTQREAKFDVTNSPGRSP